MDPKTILKSCPAKNPRRVPVKERMSPEKYRLFIDTLKMANQQEEDGVAFISDGKLAAALEENLDIVISRYSVNSFRHKLRRGEEL